ncbi:MAG: D-alanyl-D-alanine carboxypeptidase/D-alanyl-D-alanine endopeptidase [Bradymonadia bacterium]|jgi:D-alanyl-D-alanine carboxypeptidase/D-alanyl-D-alanine-endopeptidase (penicillin-binding protein 4)
MATQKTARRSRTAWALTLALLSAGVSVAPVGVARSESGRPAEGTSADALVGEPTLVAAIAPLLSAPVLRGARIGLVVSRAEGGAPLLALAPDRPLHPASNTKLLTTAAVLVRLGPDFTIDTDLVVDRLTAGAAGTLWLVGRGDPGFVLEDLWRIVDEARGRGLKVVEGDVVLDDSYFTPERMPPGFDARNTDESFRAPSGALSLNFNALRVRVSPGPTVDAPLEVSLDPDTPYARIENEGVTRKRGRPRLKVEVTPDGERVVVHVGGTLALDDPGFETRRRIVDPTGFMGEALRALLAQRGIEVRGAIRRGQAPSASTPTVLLARQTSRPLSWLAAQVNKYSNNFMAEQLLRTLGAVRRGRGGFEEGRLELLDFLERDVGTGSLKIANGSGLFGDTTVSAAQLVHVLQWVRARRPALPEFDASLAIGGTDGTLRRRMRSVPPYSVRAKTGTLNGVVALSGYTTFADGSGAAFSILFNDVPDRPWDLWQVQDGIVTAIQAHTPTPLPR